MKELTGLADRIAQAAHERDAEDPPHEVPSPSGVYDCLRKQVLTAWQTEETDPRTLRSLKKMESGKYVEDYWRDLYSRAGFRVWRPTIMGWPARIPIFDRAGNRISSGEVDCMLSGTQEVVDAQFTVPLELKDLGLWSYLDVVLKGVRDGARGYFYQVQLYLDAALEAGLITHGVAVFHAGMADASAVVWVWRNIKRLEGFPPDFYSELIYHDPAAVRWAKQRMQQVLHLKGLDSLPPREFDPDEMQKMKRSSGFPCGKLDNPYCPYLRHCMKAGGPTISREEPTYG